MDKKAVAIETIVILLLALVALLFFTVLGGKQLQLGKKISFFMPGCPKGVLITTECPCDGQKISSGYCCDFGPSQKPCFCVERNVNKCEDYKKQEDCVSNPCQVQTACTFEQGVCKRAG
ncbi:MAG: hypothetical protein QXU88_00940 [Candidatus Woesearchaeota archaeon]